MSHSYLKWKPRNILFHVMWDFVQKVCLNRSNLELTVNQNFFYSSQHSKTKYIAVVENDNIFYFASCIINKVACLSLLLDSTLWMLTIRTIKGVQRVFCGECKPKD